MPDTVVIVTGESSGELYGSLLAESLFKANPGLRILGVGGNRMKDAGVEVFAGISSSFGLVEAISTYSAIKETFRKTVSILDSESPSVVVLIDFPDFNFRVAREARKRGIKVLYYVSPQVWAWRKKRIKTMSEISDMIAVILPFEEEMYSKAGIPCEFVGHPIMDEIVTNIKDREESRRELGLDDKDNPVISLLPGSRPNELVRLFPIIVETAGRISRNYPNSRFVVPLAPNVDFSGHREHLDALKGYGAIITEGGALKAFSASDAALIASGTAALQAALIGTPFVVIYKLSPITYFIGKLIVKVKHISLANILAGEEAAPELLQGLATPDNASRNLSRIIEDTAYRIRMKTVFEKVRGMFEGRTASKRVSELVMELGGFKA